MTNTYASILAALKICPLVPVLTFDDADNANETIKKLIHDGIKVAEVTLRTAVALKAISIIKQANPDLILGAGTILSESDMKAAINAGSDFIVTPATDKKLRKALKKCKVPVFPGVATASEALTLYNHGFKYLKFFPAESSGGVKALNSIGVPMPDIKFMPTGGINANSAKDYLACPNVIAVGGSWMVR